MTQILFRADSFYAFPGVCEVALSALLGEGAAVNPEKACSNDAHLKLCLLWHDWRAHHDTTWDNF